MSVDLDLSHLHVYTPAATSNGYVAIKGRVLRFRSFINGLDAETKRRIETFGYTVS
jgi:hypothetical protein